jgi:hypothetical protein
MKILNISSQWITVEEYKKNLDVIKNNCVTMYHQPIWLDSVSKGFGVSIRAMCSTSEDNELLAITPFMVIKKGPFRALGSPLSGMFTEFSGPLFNDDLDRSDQRRVIESQHRLVLQSASYIEWGKKGEVNSKAPVLESLIYLGYTNHSRPTILVDLLPGEDKVWDNFQGRARNMIRKSIKSGVLVRLVVPTENWIQSYYEMLKATFERQGRLVPHPLSFYHEMIGLVAVKQAFCVVAESDDRMIAAAIFLIDQSRMLYLSGTANSEGMKLAANSLIQWHAIREAIRLRISAYDMGGLGVPSIDKFKKSFGGEVIHHHRWRYRSLLFKIIEPISLWAIRKGLIRIGRQ